MKKLICLIIMLTGCDNLVTDFSSTTPLIVLTFDDGDRSIIELAYPQMKEYDYPGVNFIPTGWINGNQKMTLTEVKMLEQSSWETGGHTVTHANLTTIPIDSARNEIRKNFNQLVELGLKHRCFALPAGHSNEQIDEIIKEYFQIIRTSNNERYRYPLNLSKLGYYQAEQNDDDKSLLLRVSHGISEGECLIIFGFHRFTEGDPTYITMIRMSAFSGLLKGIKERGLRVTTLSEAVDILTK